MNTYTSFLYKGGTVLGLAIVSLFFAGSVSAAGVDDFVITVQTDNLGTSSDTEFEIPVTGNINSHNYNVDCNNDGTDEITGATGNYICDYGPTGLNTGAGTYTIRIEDNIGDGTGFHRVYFFGEKDYRKLLTVEQWGTGKWSSMQFSFWQASNLTIPATDAPDLSDAISLFAMFSGATIVDPDVSGWDVSTIENFGSMFSSTTLADPDTSLWVTTAADSMGSMFKEADAADPDVSGWDMNGVTSVREMFRDSDADPDVSGWDVSTIEQFTFMFLDNTTADPDTTLWQTDAMTSIVGMFYDATSANPDVSGWDVSQVENFNNMFRGATSADPDVSNWVTSSLVEMDWMFSGASSADPDVSGWDVSNLESASQALGTTSGFSQANYDKLLTGWSVQSLHQDVELDVGGFTDYCAEDAKDILEGIFNWDIGDGDLSDFCPPRITSNGGGDEAQLTVREKTKATTVIGKDPNGDVPVYSIVGGIDLGYFEIDINSGVLTFINKPDFSNPLDDDGDNIYEVIVRASDGVFADDQTLYVEVKKKSNSSNEGTDGPSHEIFFVTPDPLAELMVGEPIYISWDITGNGGDEVRVKVTGENDELYKEILNAGKSDGFTWIPGEGESGNVNINVELYELDNLIIGDFMPIFVDESVLEEEAEDTEGEQEEDVQEDNVGDGDEDLETAPLSNQFGPSPLTGETERISVVEAGQYIRGFGYNTVYLVTEEGKRRPFWNEQTFFTYVDDWSQVLWVTDATLPTLELDVPVLPKHEIVLMKTPLEKQVYISSSSEGTVILRWIPSEELAIQLFGDDWAEYVIDIDPALMQYYSFGSDLSDTFIRRSDMRKRMQLVDMAK